jgi:hypothetical protein
LFSQRWVLISAAVVLALMAIASTISKINRTIVSCSSWRGEEEQHVGQVEKFKKPLYVSALRYVEDFA